MSNGAGGNPPYRVILSDLVASQLRGFRRLAGLAGTGEALREAMRTISERLTNAPAEFGEPIEDLHALHLTVYVAIVPPLIVDYSINEEEHIVFVTGFRAMPGWELQ